MDIPQMRQMQQMAANMDPAQMAQAQAMMGSMSPSQIREMQQARSSACSVINFPALSLLIAPVARELLKAVWAAAMRPLTPLMRSAMSRR